MVSGRDPYPDTSPTGQQHLATVSVGLTEGRSKLYRSIPLTYRTN
jgi:hypothetical protein